MKCLYTTLLLIGVTVSCGATVYTVNNNIPSPGQYNTIAAAQTAASPGDTIYITGSIYNYNSITITKKLTLIGTGHKPITPNPATSKLDAIDFSGTAANLYDCNFIGLDVSSISYNIQGTHRGYISRCRIRDGIYINLDQDSLLFEGNYFESTGYDIYVYGAYVYNNITVRNNVFNGRIYNFYPGAGGGTNIYFDNNLFLYPGFLFAASNRYLQFRNNIFYRADPNNSISNSTFDNNLIYQASTNSFPNNNSNTIGLYNQNNVDPLFVSFPSAGDYYGYSYDFNLQSSSPAKNAGTDGKDIGLTGGDGYFQKYGIPNIPSINTFSITSPANATVSPGGNLQISVMSTIGR